MTTGRATTLTDAMRAVVDAALAEIHTCLPGRVESYDWATRKARIKPLIKRAYLDTKTEPLPIIPGVPVVFPWGGSGSLSYPIEKGQTGILLFSERSLEVWLAKGGDAEPGDPRRFDLTDGFFIPGLAPFNTSGPAEADGELLLKFGIAKLRLRDGKVSIGNAQAELLDIVDQLLTKLISTTVPTAVGTYPLSSAVSGEILAIKTLLAFIK